MGWLKKLQSENKYVVFFFLYIGFCISYIDRSAIGLSLPSISKEFNLAPTEMGVVISAFFIGYSIMQIPGGWLSDHFGSKTVILIAMTLWSIFTFTTGHASTLAGLRFLLSCHCGIFSKGTSPGLHYRHSFFQLYRFCPGTGHHRSADPLVWLERYVPDFRGYRFGLRFLLCYFR